MSGKRSKKKQKTLTYGLLRMCTQRHGHADDCVGMWTWMCCVQMQMSIKEKEEEKNAHFVMQMVDTWACGCVV